jgi:ribosomal protein S18 acetylase RimI-like enzyme
MSADRSNAITIGTASREQLESALRLVFQRADNRVQELRIANALDMLRHGELDYGGVIVARLGSRLVGAIVVTPSTGACGVIWPPQCTDLPDQQAVEDALVNYAADWLRRQGAKIAQAIIPVEESIFAGSLVRQGFQHVTDVLSMHLTLAGPAAAPSVSLSFQTYDRCDKTLFEKTLQRTYEGTLDCPEVNGARAIDEVIAGHKAQGRHDPSRWFLALADGRPLGVLLLAEMADSSVWDLTYLGVIAEERGKGFGRELARKAIVTAQRAGVPELTLAVDVRNRPALTLYHDVGFEVTDRRQVYLAIWRP